MKYPQLQVWKEAHQKEEEKYTWISAEPERTNDSLRLFGTTKSRAQRFLPLFWEEVKTGLSPQNFTIKIFERLKTEGDIFKPVYEKGIDLKTLETIERVLQ
jgi:hypothetical protein